MPSFFGRFRTFLSLSFAALALAPGCNNCPLVDCGPPVTLRLNLPVTAQAGDEVTACHLATCVTATLPAAAAPGNTADLSFSLSDVQGMLVTRADGSLQLRVSWWAAAQRDRYTLTVRDAAGTELASLDDTAIFPVASLSSGACPMCVSVELGDPA
jgi:hypothetical protein